MNIKDVEVVWSLTPDESVFELDSLQRNDITYTAKDFNTQLSIFA
jgi:hypothetical protein